MHDASRAAYGWQRDGGHAEYLLTVCSSLVWARSGWPARCWVERWARGRWSAPTSHRNGWRSRPGSGWLARWRLHPEAVVTDRFGLDQAGAAYELADRGTAGKV
jgi:hypothetical protein